MRKVTTTVAAALVAFSFAACNKTNNSAAPEIAQGSTYTKFRVAEAGLRAVTDGQLDVNGVGGESVVASGLFITKALGQQDFTNLTAVSPFTAAKGEEAAWESDVVAYNGTTGQANAGFILNTPAAYTPADFRDDATVGIDKLGDMTKDVGFTMTSKTDKEVTIKQITDENKVKDENSNLFSFEVERVVSKVQASKVADVTMPADGIVSDLRYSVAGSAKEAYIFRDKAGERTLAEKSGKFVYDGFTSAIHTLAATTFTGNKINKARDLQKVSDATASNVVAPKAETADKWADNHSLVLAEDANYTKASNAKGIYFLENSLDLDVKAPGVLNFNDIVYVKFYGTFAPKDNKVIEKGTSGDYTYTNDLSSEITEYVPLSGKQIKAYYTSDEAGNIRHKEMTKIFTDKEHATAVTESKIADLTDDTLYYVEITHAANTFFVGVQTKKYYRTITAALTDGNTNTKKYQAGKMVWKTPANSQLSADKSYTNYADTRRNNIYSLQLTEIKAIGDNYDKLDTDDPNIPEPENPTEPDPDEKEEVDPETIYIKVKCTILKWNLVHRGVVLG